MEILPQLLISRRRLSLAETKPIKIGGSFGLKLGQNKGPFSQMEISKVKTSSKLLFSTRSTSFRSTKRSSLSSHRYDKQKQTYEQKLLTNRYKQESAIPKQSLLINIQSFQVMKLQAQNQLLNNKSLLESVKSQSNILSKQFKRIQKTINQELQIIFSYGKNSIKTLKQAIMSFHQSVLDDKIMIDKDIKMINQGMDILRYERDNIYKRLDYLENTFGQTKPNNNN